MKHLLDTPKGAMAKNQQELVASTMNLSKNKREVISDHNVCEFGLVIKEGDKFRRMSWEEVEPVFHMLLRLRPSAMLLDVRPSTIEATEEVVVSRSPEHFRTTFLEKAKYLSDLWIRNPDMVGFLIQIHDLNPDLPLLSQPSQPTVTYKIYKKTSETPPDVAVPIVIDVEFRRLR